MASSPSCGGWRRLSQSRWRSWRDRPLGCWATPPERCWQQVSRRPKGFFRRTVGSQPQGLHAVRARRSEPGWGTDAVSAGWLVAGCRGGAWWWWLGTSSSNCSGVPGSGGICLPMPAWRRRPLNRVASGSRQPALSVRRDIYPPRPAALFTSVSSLPRWRVMRWATSSMVCRIR
jgi:hypothetical protein